jgi:hypothetical protein
LKNPERRAFAQRKSWKNVDAHADADAAHEAAVDVSGAMLDAFQRVK